MIAQGAGMAMTVREMISRLSAEPDPDAVMTDAFDEDGAFPASRRQITPLMSALKYQNAADTGNTRLASTAAAQFQAGLEGLEGLDDLLTAVEDLRARTNRTVAELITAGEDLLDRLRRSRDAWEVARQRLINLLRTQVVTAVGRRCNAIGDPRPGTVPHEIPHLIWYGPVTLTDDGRIIGDGTEPEGLTGTAAAEWAFSDVRLLVANLEVMSPRFDEMLGPRIPAEETSHHKASDTRIHKALTAVYSYAVDRGMKPPNVKEVAAPVPKAA